MYATTRATTTTTAGTLRCFGNRHLKYTRIRHSSVFLLRPTNKKHKDNNDDDDNTNNKTDGTRVCHHCHYNYNYGNNHAVKQRSLLFQTRKKHQYHSSCYDTSLVSSSSMSRGRDDDSAITQTTKRCHSSSSSGGGNYNNVLDDYDLRETPDMIPELQPNQRLVAIGDVHGDYHQLQRSMITARVVDPSDPQKWIGQNTIVVQIGDVLDRGKQELLCWKYLCRLSHQAAKHGGHVVLLWGNHEVWNTTGLFPWGDPSSRHNYDTAIKNKNDMFHAYGFQTEFRQALEEEEEKEDDSTTTTAAAVAANNNNNNNPSKKKQSWRKTRLLPNLILNNNSNNKVADQQTINNIILEMSSRWKALEPGGLLSKPLLSKLKVAVQVGRSVFVHAGLLQQHLLYQKQNETTTNNNENNHEKNHSKKNPGASGEVGGGGIRQLNQIARDWILSSSYNDDKNDYNSNSINSYGEKRIKHVFDTMPSFLSDDQSAVWMRDYSSPANSTPPDIPKVERMIDNLFQELRTGGDGVEVDRLVMGHTPQSCINSILNGKLWRIDIGTSAHMYGTPPEVLEITSTDTADENEDKSSPYQEQVFILTWNGEKIPEDRRTLLDKNTAAAKTAASKNQ